MDAPKGLISVDIYNLAACYPQTLAVVAAQSKNQQFEALGYVLTILKNSPLPLVKKHITFCGKLLPFIEQGVQEGKLALQKTKEVMQRFVEAGVFLQLDPSVRVSQVQLGRRSDCPAEKVSVALLPFMSSPFAQLLEHRLKQEESYLEISLSLPARQALKHFLETLEMPAAPLKPSVLLELCRLENELHKAPERGPFCRLVAEVLDTGLGREKVEKASVDLQLEDLSSDEEEKIEEKPLHVKKKMIKSLFEIQTVQDALDCYALVKLVYGGYEKEESCLLLHKLTKMLEAFESEEGLLALNQIAADLNSILDPIKQKKREIKEVLKVSVRKFFARSKEEIASHPDTKPIICCGGYSDDKHAFKLNFDWSVKIVANETLRVNALRSYSSYGDKDGIGLEAFKLMTSHAQGYLLRMYFYMLMITKENVSLLGQIEEKKQLDGIDTVYTEVELEQWQKEKLQKIFPNLRTIQIVDSIQESKASKRRLSKEKPLSDAFAHLTSYEEAFKPLGDKNDELNRERVELLKKLGPLAKTGRPLKDLVDFQWPLHHYHGNMEPDKRNAETVNGFLKLLQRLTHFDAKLINEFRYACYSDFLSACAIGTYVKPNGAGDKKVMIGLEALPYMQGATPLGEALRKSFDALILTEGKGERAVEGRRLARLLELTPSEELPLNNVTHLYVSKKIDPAILAELFDLIPVLKDKPIVFCEPLEASMDAALSQMDTKTPDCVRISF
ncbi:MAG: hypothetical protein LLG04_05880 [Parachlamydia sp.]|nr:hypothetical protein [Parachlamydia sp.]